MKKYFPGAMFCCGAVAVAGTAVNLSHTRVVEHGFGPVVFYFLAILSGASMMWNAIEQRIERQAQEKERG